MAGKIPQEFIDELVARTDIVELIDSRVPLKKAGREFTACCPFHNEKSPSFTVSPTKQFYHCFGCGAHGTAIGFLMEYEHMEFPEAVEDLARRAGLTVPRIGGDSRDDAPRQSTTQPLFDLLSEAAGYFRYQLKNHAEAPKAIDYMKGRGLSGEIAKDFGIGYAPSGWQNLIEALANHPARHRLAEAGLVIEAEGKRYDRFRHRIMFPIRDTRGRIIGFGGRVLSKEDTPKYLNSPETPVFHKGKELYGLYEARQALRDLPRLLVVEGYMDVVALAQFGIRYAVATLGTAVTREHLERLFRTTSEVVFCFDGDRAGRGAAWRGLENAMPLMREGYQVKFMFLPEGEDPDTLVRKIGREAFEAEIGKALPLSVFLIEELSHQVDMRSLDGRAQLVEKVRPLVAPVPEGIYRRLLIEAVAQFARVEPTQLMALLEGKTPAPAAAEGRAPSYVPRREAPPTARGPAPGRSAPSPVRHALSLLLQEPALAQAAGDPSRFSGLRQPGISLLVEVIDLLQKRPNLTWGGLLEHWRGTEEGRHLMRLAAKEMLLEAPETLEHEFLGALDILERQFLSQRREELEERFNRRTITEVEKVELQQLMTNLPGAPGRNSKGN
ncbi:MAG TPA: DNA primase [Geothrix sp.]|nr:DNA primase [Geothrix sp.]